MVEILIAIFLANQTTLLLLMIFLNLHLLHRCDVAIGFNVNYTFFTDTSGSSIDYFMSTECKRVINFDVIDSGSNLSDHLSLLIRGSSNIELVSMLNKPTFKDLTITRLRWDHADVTPYYAATGYYL